MENQPNNEKDEKVSREQHLDWCKKRALGYLDNGDIQNAWSSMVSDLRKHEETKDHKAIELGMQLYLFGGINSIDGMRKFIEGFN